MKYALPLCLLLIMVTACKTSPVHQYDAMPVSHTHRVAIDMAEIEATIAQACVDTGWTPKTVGPGHIEATYVLRNHKAMVDIRFDLVSYGIHYKESELLKYDGVKIHRAYNSWVDGLQSAIDKRLASAHYK